MKLVFFFWVVQRAKNGNFIPLFVSICLVCICLFSMCLCFKCLSTVDIKIFLSTVQGCNFAPFAKTIHT